MKKILAACYDRYLEFDSKEEREQYIVRLDEGQTTYHILDKSEINGKYRLRIQVRYNRNPMFQELDSYPRFAVETASTN